MMRTSTLLLAVAILGAALPSTVRARRRAALHSAADEVRSLLLVARMRAAERDRGVGVRFVRIDGAWHHVLYDDGNGDGVRRTDIANGIDPPAMPPIRVLAPGAIAVESVNELCIFSPDGSASPCVIALANDAGDREYVTQREVS